MATRDMNCKACPTILLFLWNSVIMLFLVCRVVTFLFAVTDFLLDLFLNLFAVCWSPSQRPAAGGSRVERRREVHVLQQRRYRSSARSDWGTVTEHSYQPSPRITPPTPLPAGPPCYHFPHHFPHRPHRTAYPLTKGPSFTSRQYTNNNDDLTCVRWN